MSGTITRREFVRAGLAGGALLVARPSGVLGKPLKGPKGEVAPRESKLFRGTTLVHADLHNHSLMSDGDGDAAQAFGLMHDAGLDVAALTDHSSVSYGLPQSLCLGNKDCQSLAGIDEASWAETRRLADAEHVDGSFVAIRGFEWSSPTLGHVNVWFSDRWIDPLHTGGTSTGEGAAQFAHDEISAPSSVTQPLDDLVRAAPTTGAGMSLFYEWLRSDTGRPGLGGGGQTAIAGFNHPGREPGRFGYFAHDRSVADRMVSMEIFNRSEDYLYEGTDSGVGSPLNDCLNAGWRVGLLGVTDEHGTNWGTPLGKGRGGLWVKELTRDGVREAMLARRFFATRERGLRLAATANGVAMGGAVGVTLKKGRPQPVRFALDVARGPEWIGKTLNVQLLQPGTTMPRAADAFEFDVSRKGIVTFESNLAADSRWVVLRVTDPEGEADGRADGEYRSFGNGIAYASPFYLQPA